MQATWKRWSYYKLIQKKSYMYITNTYNTNTKQTLSDLSSPSYLLFPFCCLILNALQLYCRVLSSAFIHWLLTCMLNCALCLSHCIFIRYYISSWEQYCISHLLHFCLLLSFYHSYLPHVLAIHKNWTNVLPVCKTNKRWKNEFVGNHLYRSYLSSL